MILKDQFLIMNLHIFSQTVLLLAACLPLVNAAPTRRGSNPPLRGGDALVGYSPSEQVASGTQPDIQYSLLPGQKVDPNLGGYLDFENVKNPQPIRGTTGSDDPGPRTFTILLFGRRCLCPLRKLLL